MLPLVCSVVISWGGFSGHSSPPIQVPITMQTKSVEVVNTVADVLSLSREDLSGYSLFLSHPHLLPHYTGIGFEVVPS